MKKFASALAATIALLGFQGTSMAQILVETNERCADAWSLPYSVAQARYAWASYCRNNPAGGRSGPAWLNDASDTAYKNASADLKPRLYPIYFNFVTNSSWTIPTDAYSPSNNCSKLPAGASNLGLCVAGCFPGEASITFSDGEVAIKEARNNGRVDIVTLSPEATLDGVEYIKNQVAAYSATAADELQILYTFKTASGGRIQVTHEHPLLTGDGRMRQAKALVAGDSLVRADGSSDKIISVDVTEMFGKVYHLKPTTLDYQSNIIVAQGFLNGSSRYQNEFLTMVNQVVVRRALADEFRDVDAAETVQTAP